MTRYWIGVAAQEHVQRGTGGGFCQLCHGKEGPLRRMAPGDWLIYYSPRNARDGGETVQAFTAIGRVTGEAVRQVTQSEGFSPFRRDVAYLPARPAPIRPLLGELAFIRNPERWGMTFRPGHLEVSEADFRRIAAAMGVDMALIPAPVQQVGLELGLEHDAA